MKSLKTILLANLLWALPLWQSCTTIANTQKTGQDAQQYHIDNKLGQDSAMNAEIAPYRDSLASIMDQVIGHAEAAFTKSRPEGLLNDFTADMVYNYVNHTLGKKADIALLNYGGLRSDLPQGNITRRNIYELMPFDNEVVILTLKPETFRKLLDYMAETGGMPASGIRLEVKNKKPVKVLVNEQAYDSARSYTVAVSDYLANGGDNMDFLRNAERETLNLKLRDLFIDYIVQATAHGEILKEKLDGRFRILE